jgi:hypothetical protein
MISGKIEKNTSPTTPNLTSQYLLALEKIDPVARINTRVFHRANLRWTDMRKNKK